MTSKPLLQQAISAYKAGHRGKARALLLQFVEIDQQNELSWLLLSNLVHDLDDRIIALENALTINPNNEKAANQLWKLKQKRNQVTPIDLTDAYQHRLDEALKAIQQGQDMLAYSILRQLVREDDRSEQAWLLLSELSPDTDSEITALQNLLMLNPQHHEGRARLEKLQRYRNDPLALAKLYEDWGQPEKAQDIYVRIAFEGGSVAERREAERRMENKIIRESIPNMRLVSPKLTLVRMMAGPLALYAVLAFIHGGLNPLKISPIFWLGGISVFVGSYLMVVGAEPETRILWQQLWKNLGGKENAPLKGVTSLGILLWILPVALMILDGIIRFMNSDLLELLA
ncbi:MAG: tetratricopeptide repeat protein [Anaerolineales bacterium]